ncbi:hypothetical protein ACQEVF_58805 [Nonomuraea polychroma]|uniref:hypothetical protein n=1 Tax=Nonomuraea polychroma TaxID=46176 RepID=UPI003D8FF975
MRQHRFDPEQVAQAATLEQRYPSWLVMWRFWARKFTAWHLADPRECRIVDATTARELRDLMVGAELEFWWVSPAAHTGQPFTPVRPADQAHQAEEGGPAAHHMSAFLITPYKGISESTCPLKQQK